MHDNQIIFTFKYKISFSKNQIGINQHRITTCKHQPHLRISNRHLEKYKSFTQNQIEAHH